MSGIIRDFSNEAELSEWLCDRSADCGSRQDFEEWLEQYFEEGNSIKVQNKFYNFFTCIKLIQ